MEIRNLNLKTCGGGNELLQVFLIWAVSGKFDLRTRKGKKV